MSTTYPITFGDRLRRTRLTLGLDQRQLAQELDVHHATISRYEHNGGRNDAPTRRLAALMQLRYGVDADWLLTGAIPAQRDSHQKYRPSARPQRHLVLVEAA